MKRDQLVVLCVMQTDCDKSKVHRGHIRGLWKDEYDFTKQRRGKGRGEKEQHEKRPYLLFKI